MSSLSKFVATSLFLATSVLGWTDAGHMITAGIATLGLLEKESYLGDRSYLWDRYPENKSSQTYDNGDDKLGYFTNITDALYSKEVLDARHIIARQKDSSNSTSLLVSAGAAYEASRNLGYNGKDDLVNIATWEDNIGISFHYQKGWHFSDMPVRLDDGCKMPEQVTHDMPVRLDVPQVTQDVIYGLSEAYEALTGESTFFTDPAITAFQHSYWLRSFVHFLGDIHQPLHSSTGCSRKHPYGDRGGNLYRIRSNIINFFEGKKMEVKELHLLWDLAGGLYAEGPNYPLNATTRAFVFEEAKRLREKFFDDKDSQKKERMEILLKEIDDIPTKGRNVKEEVQKYFSKIRDESWSHSKAESYTNITENEMVSDFYVHRAQKVSEERIALGGIRLWGWLEKIYKMRKHREQEYIAKLNALKSGEEPIQEILFS